jgi:hypothetical protein
MNDAVADLDAITKVLVNGGRQPACCDRCQCPPSKHFREKTQILERLSYQVLVKKGKTFHSLHALERVRVMDSDVIDAVLEDGRHCIDEELVKL